MSKLPFIASVDLITPPTDYEVVPRPRAPRRKQDFSSVKAFWVRVRRGGRVGWRLVAQSLTSPHIQGGST